MVSEPTTLAMLIVMNKYAAQCNSMTLLSAFKSFFYNTALGEQAILGFDYTDIYKKIRITKKIKKCILLGVCI